VKTVAFFDLFDYPLTSWEVWILGYWDTGILNTRYWNIGNLLDSGGLDSIIESKNGFYYLQGREGIIKTRMARYNYTDRKFKRAMRVAKLFKFIPWIKMIAVGNIIGAHNLKDRSDIDFFIITENKRIWITRFFCAGLMKLLGMRPKEGNEQDKICLSFFVSESAMDLQKLMLGSRSSESFSPVLREGLGSGDSDEAKKNPTSDIRHPTSDNDIYFIYWLAGLALIYDTGGVYEKFIQTNNWIKECLPNWQPMQAAGRRDSGKGFSNFYYDLADLLFGGLEKNVKKLQLKKLPCDLKNLMNKDTRVVINDQVLKLHVKDRREEYRRRWMEKVAEIEMAEWILK